MIPGKEITTIHINTRFGCVYEILNTIDNKGYIGGTAHPRQRILGHFSSLKRNKHPNKMMQDDFNKHGINGFAVRILKTVERNLLTNGNILMEESDFIRKRNPFYNSHC